MNKYIHFHFYSKLIAMVIVLIASIFLLQKSELGIAQGVPPNEVEIGGWAWNESVGWISLNCKNDFDGDGLLEDTCSTYPYKLEVSSVGNVIGCAWGGTSRNANVSTTIGYICFSDPGSTEAPTYGTHIAHETGYCDSDTACDFDSDCNANDDKWRCNANVCEVECTADNEVAVCGLGQTCNVIVEKNFLCPGTYAWGINNLWNCWDNMLVPSILDLEVYGADENLLHLPKSNPLDATGLPGLTYGNSQFNMDNPNLYWGEDGFDGPYYQYDNPIEGCFNCSEQRIGNCLYRAISCVEGDTVCEDVGILDDRCEADDFCYYADTECTVDDDCPDLTDECLVDDVVYNCENCLEYFYYDQYNATTSLANQCKYSQAACEYVETTYPSGYKYKNEILIDGDSYTGEDFTNFPLLIYGTIEDLRHTSKGGLVDHVDGYDIIFTTTSDGTNPLPHELEQYNYRSGVFTAWVQVPLISASEDTYINMFYGNTSISTSTEDLASLWSEYYFVSHMNNISSYEVSESVSSTLNGTKAGFNSPTGTTSGFSFKVAGAQDFDGVGDYIDFGDISVSSLPVTISGWLNVSSYVGDAYDIVTSDDNASSPNYGVYLQTADRLIVGFGNGSGTQTRETENDPGGIAQEGYIVGVIAGTDYSDMFLYKNGVEVAGVYNTGTNLSTYSDNATTSAPLVTGRRGNTHLTGALEEIRIAKVARSANWIYAEYRNNSQFSWGTSGFVQFKCRERYSSSTNGDQSCDFTNPDYPDFNHVPIDESCDLCEEHEFNSFFKVLGGYDCSLCIVEDFDNSCTQNALGANRNRCEKCSTVYTTPGVMYDNKYNTLESTSTSACNIGQGDPSEDDFCKRANICGWGVNAWAEDNTDDFGLGWFQFSPRITSSSRPYFSVESGNIYSKGNIYSRYSPPFGKYNATYLIESGGEITNIISSSTISDTYEGELSNRPTIDFFELLSIAGSRKYKSSLGLIDYTGIVTNMSGGTGDGTNKYGASIDYTTSLVSGLENDQSLNGKVYTTDTGVTFNNSTSTMIHIDAIDSSGIIVVNGDLNINRDIYYEDIKIPSTKINILNHKLIPSLVWIVKGDVIIDPSVNELVGTFIVLGEDGTTCPSVPGVSSCGTFDTGVGFNQLVVNGSVLAHQFVLGRTYSDVDGNPSEKFINTGRLQANPPKGLVDLNKLSPRYNF